MKNKENIEPDIDLSLKSDKNYLFNNISNSDMEIILERMYEKSEKDQKQENIIKKVSKHWDSFFIAALTSLISWLIHKESGYLIVVLVSLLLCVVFLNIEKDNKNYEKRDAAVKEMMLLIKDKSYLNSNENRKL